MTIAATVLIVNGALTLLGALFLIPDAVFFLGLVGMGLMLLIGAAGALLLITAVKALRGAPWARKTGIVLALVGAVSRLGVPDGMGSLAVSLILLVAYGYAAYALWTNPGWFAPRRPAG